MTVMAFPGHAGPCWPLSLALALPTGHELRS
jgi:hypothetical protein